MKDENITKAEESITICYNRVYALKAKLRSGTLKTQHKDQLQQELIEVEKLLATNKRILKNLNKSEKPLYLIACGFFLICFVCWMLYHLFFGDTFDIV